MPAWSSYYDKHAVRQPRKELAQAVEAVATVDSEPRHAADLGFGQGTETLALLEQGWRVLAVDAEGEAERRLRARLAAGMEDRLEVITAPFNEVVLPPCDLVWSGLALPFCDPADFEVVWRRIGHALRPGGVVAMDLFGLRHTWATRTTTLSRDDVEGLLSGLDVLTLEEQDAPRETVNDGVIQWHAFFVIARRPA